MRCSDSTSLPFDLWQERLVSVVYGLLRQSKLHFLTALREELLAYLKLQIKEVMSCVWVYWGENPSIITLMISCSDFYLSELVCACIDILPHCVFSDSAGLPSCKGGGRRGRGSTEVRHGDCFTMLVSHLGDHVRSCEIM